CVYSAAGHLKDPGLMRWRPFRAPHHTISGIGLVGGGSGPRAGEVTLAHHGVLFLDEMAEFGRATLDVLRQPLEDGAVVITRANRATRMPADFTLVGAMNPCVCGNLGRSDRPCGCTPAMVAHYRSRVSGPLLDRFDIQVEVPPVPLADLRDGPAGEGSEAVASRVAAARRLQAGRLAGTGALTNASMPPALLRRHARPDAGGRRILALALRRLGLSARAHDAILKVARTIADVEGSEAIRPEHVAEAVQYRTLDRGVAEAEGGGFRSAADP
ncbi:MAG: ATP-binding protein, partial [Acidobacteria bacterium]|nr:ATP-binding protein [Acidobacteriota bacterium]